jgi:hypothetical protein
MVMRNFGFSSHMGTPSNLRSRRRMLTPIFRGTSMSTALRIYQAAHLDIAFALILPLFLFSRATA